MRNEKMSAADVLSMLEWADRQMRHGKDEFSNDSPAIVRYRQARAAVADMIAEHNEDQGVIAVWRGRCERAEAERDALIAERDALREDAERYKFMVYMGVGVVCVESGKYSLMACDGNWYDGSEHATPREAIDAAREEFNHADQS